MTKLTRKARHYTKREMIEMGNDTYGRGYYRVEVYKNQGYDESLNKTFTNYMNAYNYMSDLIVNGIMCGFDILEWDNTVMDFLKRGEIAC